MYAFKPNFYFLDFKLDFRSSFKYDAFHENHLILVFEIRIVRVVQV